MFFTWFWLKLEDKLKWNICKQKLDVVWENINDEIEIEIRYSQLRPFEPDKAKHKSCTLALRIHVIG